MIRVVLDLNELLRHTVEHGGSDLHVKVGTAPHVRTDGRLSATPFDKVVPADTERMAFAILPQDRADEFVATAEADFAYSVAGLGRFRVNIFRQRGSVGLVFRRVLPGIPSFESLGLPGFGYHSDLAEYVMVDAIPRRLYMASKLIMDLGASK